MRSVIGEEIVYGGDGISRAGISKSTQEVIGQRDRPDIRQRSVEPSSALVVNAPENTPVER